MPYYRTCPYCKSNLDPGESCDCQKKDAPPSDHGEASQQRNEAKPPNTDT